MAYVNDSTFETELVAWGIADSVSEELKISAKAQAEAWVKTLIMKFRGTADDELLEYYATLKALAAVGKAVVGQYADPQHYPAFLKEAMAECHEILKMPASVLPGGINQRRISRGV